MEAFVGGLIEGDIQRLSDSDPIAASALRSKFGELKQAYAPFGEALHEQLLGIKPAISAADYFALGSTVLDKSSELHGIATPLLQGKLDARLIEFRHRSGMVLGVSLGCWMLATYFFFGFMRSLSATLRGLGRASTALAAGDFPERIVLHTADELQDIADEVAKVTSILRRFDEAQRDVARRHDLGETDARIDVDRFQGAFRGMAEALNSAFDGHIRVQERMTQLIGHYARGNLEPVMDRLPGKRAEITNSFDQVRERLQNVNAQILRLSQAATRGEFSLRGDAAGLEFTFCEMVEGLNRLMENAERGLRGVSDVLGAVSRGDLGARMEGDYAGMFAELQRNANATVEQLARLVGRIQAAAETIGTASREIAMGNTNLSARTEQQAVSLEETATSMESLTGTVRQNADHAKQANQLAIGASQSARKGGEVVGAVIETMESIRQASQQIVDIIAVIDGIAFQTNILALNAAVEAARAGEQGRGFAVVASEVRSLAQRSAAAAHEVKGLITTSVERVEAGGKLVERAGSTMNDIVASVGRVTDIIGEIAAASHEQSVGIDQIGRTIAEMDDATQQNAALVEEASASARSLEEQAAGMVGMVKVFAVGKIEAGSKNTTTLPQLRTGSKTRPSSSARPAEEKPQPAAAGQPPKQASKTATPPPRGAAMTPPPRAASTGFGRSDESWTEF
jgi:methyl-accepting chemotaxis protein